jgi:recombination protein RecT
MGALVPFNQFKAEIEKRKAFIASVIPRSIITPDRMVNLILSAAARKTKLIELAATPAGMRSLIRAFMQAVQLGLEPDTPLQLAHIIPYAGEAQFQAGYRGLMELAQRSGRIDSMQAEVVHEGELNQEHGYFEYEMGSAPRLTFRKGLTDRGKAVCVWALAHIKDAKYPTFVVLGEDEIELARRSSPAVQKNKKDSPWFTNPDSMWRKTAIKRLCNYIPRSTELARAIELDDQAERGERQTFDITIEEADEAPAAVTAGAGKPALPEGHQELTEAEKERLKVLHAQAKELEARAGKAPTKAPEAAPKPQPRAAQADELPPEDNDPDGPPSAEEQARIAEREQGEGQGDVFSPPGRRPR